MSVIMFFLTARRQEHVFVDFSLENNLSVIVKQLCMFECVKNVWFSKS